MTRFTWVCCSMTSETKIAYGSLVRRHGRSRAYWLYQAKSASCIAAEVVTAMAARYRPRRLLRTPCEHHVVIHAVRQTHVALRGRQVWAPRSTRSPMPDGAPKRVNEWPSTRTAAPTADRWIP